MLARSAMLHDNFHMLYCFGEIWLHNNLDPDANNQDQMLPLFLDE